MDAALQARLLELNRSFYEQFARPFADSRSSNQESLAAASAYAVDGGTVLDAGCGDGRLARALVAAGRRVHYTGIDGSAALIALAQERSVPSSGIDVRFAVADLTQANWSAALAGERFDAVFCLAVLHHIPGQANRQQLVEQMAGLLVPGGRLIISTWQFLDSPRLRRKVLPWQRVGLAEGQVEPGDYLLDWQRGGYGLRYCALIDEADLRAMCLAAGLSVEKAFRTDRGLNLFVVAHH